MSLEIARPIIVDVMVPGILLTCSAFQSYSSKFHWLIWLIGMAVFVAYTFIKGEWFLFGYYLRFILLLGYGLAIVASCRSITDVPFFASTGPAEFTGLVFLVIFSPLTIVALRGYRHVGKAVEASFPLRNGRYCIAQGGNSAIINHHVPADYSRFAIDIVKINRFGFRARGFYPKDLNKYLIFEEIVYSPVEGQVVKAVNGLPDMVPPAQDRDHPAGNHVIVKHSGSNALVFLVHLRLNSLLVNEGNAVSLGQPIGRIGNSGISTEPHLHIHCELDEVEEYNTTGKGVPLFFNGRFLRRNSLVKSQIGSEYAI